MRHFARRVAALACGVALLALGCRDEPYGVGGPELIFGRTGLGPGEFSYPRAGVYVPDVGLLVVDKTARIQCFDLDGTFRYSWRMPEHAAGKPTGLGLGPDGQVYVADTHYSRVLVFSPQGDEHARFGRRGAGLGEFLLPTDVAVDATGRIYAAEYSGNDRITRFTPGFEPELTFDGSVGGDVSFRRPQCLLFDEAGNLWVADSCNHRICQLSPDGELLSSFGRSGTEPGALRFPYGMDWLSDGTLVVAEYGNNRVQRFSRAGRSLGTWGRAGRKPGELAYPWAVVVGPEDRIYVIDSGNNRVQVFDGGRAANWTPP